MSTYKSMQTSTHWMIYCYSLFLTYPFQKSHCASAVGGAPSQCHRRVPRRATACAGDRPPRPPATPVIYMSESKLPRNAGGLFTRCRRSDGPNCRAPADRHRRPPFAASRPFATPLPLAPFRKALFIVVCRCDIYAISALGERRMGGGRGRRG